MMATIAKISPNPPLLAKLGTAQIIAIIEKMLKLALVAGVV